MKSIVYNFARNYLSLTRGNSYIENIFKSDLKLIKDSGFFDPKYYLRQNADVAVANITDPSVHFLVRGGLEGRSPSERFNTQWYLSKYPDVANANQNPLIHYLRHGRAEGRLPHPDYGLDKIARRYRDDYRTIRSSGLFDTRYYRDSYPDVAKTDVDPIYHYCRYGWREGRNPTSDFSTAYYLRKHKDVAIAGVNPFAHWLQHGREEGRTISLKVVKPKVETSDFDQPSVIFVSHEASKTGAPIVLLAFMKWLSTNTDIKFRIIVGQSGPLNEAFEALAPTYFMDQNEEIDLRGALSRFCGFNVQLVYGNTIVSEFILRHLDFLHCPFVCHVHEQENLFKIFETEVINLCKYVDKFITVSKGSSAALARRLGSTVSDPKIFEIPPFIVQQESASDSAPTLRVNERDFIVFGCGTIEERKGFDLFCDTAAQLRNLDCKNVKMYWIGPAAPSHADPSQIIKDKQVGDIVTWLGSHPNPRQLLSEGNVFLLPSREDPFPLVCLEAASAGLPIICFDEQAGGMHQFVADDAGIVVPYLDTYSMAQAVKRLSSNPGLLKSLGQTAHQRVKDNYYVEAIAPRIHSLFPPITQSQSNTALDALAEQIDAHSVISFDIFDTLITRRVSNPNVIFDVAELAHTKIEPGALSLFDERMDVAGRVLSSYGGRKDDISLSSIYEEMAVYADIQIERNVEIDLCQPHQLGLSLFNRAVENGKIVVLASDMYLDRSVILEMLERCGIRGFHHLYLSSEIGKKKDTGRLYAHMLNALNAEGYGPDDILHIGDNWESDVFKAREAGIKAIRFPPLYEVRGQVAPIADDARTYLPQAGRIWEAVCTQKYRVWADQNPQLAQDTLVKLGFELTGPLATQLAMMIEARAKEYPIANIAFLARDGRILKDAFDHLFAEDIESKRFHTSYLHLSRSTVLRATLQDPLSSSDIYFLMEGLHLNSKSLSYFLEKSGLDTTDSTIRSFVDKQGLRMDDVLGWHDRLNLAKLLKRLAPNIFAANKSQRNHLECYLSAQGLLKDGTTALVDVGWLLNIQSRLEKFIHERNPNSHLTGFYFGSRDRSSKSIDYNTLLFRRSEPSAYARLVEQNTTLFELLFSSPEAAALGWTNNNDGGTTVVLKDQTNGEEAEKAKRIQYGAREFFRLFDATDKALLTYRSPDYLIQLFESLVKSKDETTIAALSDVSIALGGSHEFEVLHNLIPSNSNVDYTIAHRPEYFRPISFSNNTFKSNVLIVTAAGIDNGSTRYRAVNMARALFEAGLTSTVIHAATPLDEFALAIKHAHTIIFQRCFFGQGNIKSFYEKARAAGLQCLGEIDDLVFPEYVNDIGSVAGGEWDIAEAKFVSNSYFEMMKKMDAHITSTPKLASYLAGTFGKEVALFRNGIQEEYLINSDLAEPNKTITIGYASGTRSHQRDFLQIETVLFDFLRINHNVHLDIIGAAQVSNRLLTLPNVRVSPLLDYRTMLKHYARMDMMLVPLENNIFNECKSSVKFVECGAVGTAVLASATSEYQDAIVDGKNGYLASTTAEWSERLQSIADSSSNNRRMGAAALETVRSRFTLNAKEAAHDVCALIANR